MTAPAPSAAMLPLRYRVAESWRELSDVATLVLEPAGDAIGAFAPGQFNMLYAFGVGEAAISISGDPDAQGRLVHTIREVGAVSGALAGAGPGQMLGVRGPFGAPWPVDTQGGRHLLFVAGGLGLAPLRPAILRAIHNADRYAGITLLVGARSPLDLLFASEVAGWAGAGRVRLIVTVDHAPSGWQGHVGVVTTRLNRALEGVDPANVSAFVCGPEIMMRFTCQDLRDAGVPEGRQFVSLERNMKCAVGFCGHCQFGADFVCRDGPVFAYDAVARRLQIREL